MAQAESVAVHALHARLRQLGAEYQAARSSAGAHIYYARPLGRWLRVTRVGNTARIEYHATCPCSGGG